MAIREHECKEHGIFEVWVSIVEPVLESQPCPECWEPAPWVPSRLGLFKMEGRTTKG